MKKILPLIACLLIGTCNSVYALDLAESNSIALNLDDLWVLVAAAFVFFMQAGFKVLETGLVKAEHRSGIGAKNLLDWVAGSLAFFLVGFAIMFGDSTNGFFGMNLFAGEGLLGGKSFIFFLFQLAFAGTALTIVSGAMSGRTGIIPYFIASMMTAMFIYPVFGHWAWGNLLNEANTPWLVALGFMDFAGSTVVHSTGAWVALVGIYMVGPRIGRYDSMKKLQPMKASDYSYSILGVMILWLGWWGFNGGSTLAFNDEVPQIILNTNLSGAAACFAAFFHAFFFQKKRDIIEKIAGGSLTGLVAITACCNIVTPLSSIAIGFCAGILHNIFYVIISEKWELDDPVGAIAVHGIGGVFGTLCVGLFGREELLLHARWMQIGIQFIGILTCFLFTAGSSFIIFLIIKKTIGIRVSPKQETSGSFIGEPVISEAGSNEDAKVNQVSVRVSERGHNLMSIPEYLSISQKRRKELIFEDRVTYLDEKGAKVSSLVAVRQLGLMLESQKDEISLERDIIKKKNEEIDESIQHANKVQTALLGESKVLEELFSSSFVMYKPKNDLSGDFYWMRKSGNYKVVLVADSNRSGVSGSFLSMLGVSLINELFSENKLNYPDKILEMFNAKFMKSMRSKSLTSKLTDTLDVSLIIVDEMKKEVHFSGANNDIYFYHGDQRNHYKGDSSSLGQQSFQYKRKTIRYVKGNRIYMFTNGYYNQLNLEERSMTKEVFLNQLDQVYDFDFETQKHILKENLDEWAKGAPQTEDVLILGVELE